MEVHQIILPGYSFLQEIVSQTINIVEQDSKNILQNNLSEVELKQLDELFSDSQGLYEITNLKREPKDFTLNEISAKLESVVKSKHFIKSEQKSALTRNF